MNAIILNSPWQAQPKVAVIFTWNSCIPERFADVRLHSTQQRKRSTEMNVLLETLSRHKCKRGLGEHLFTLSVMPRRLKLPLGSLKSPGWGAEGTPVNSAALMVSLSTPSEMRFESSGDFRCVIALPWSLNLKFMAKMDVKFADGTARTTNKGSVLNYML